MAVLGKTQTSHFLFIHNYRTGGTSIRNILKPYFSLELVDYHCSLQQLTHFYQHYSFEEKQQFSETFKFAFIRNPYEWLFSLYNYMRFFEGHPMNEAVKDKSFSEFPSWFIYKQLKCNNPSAMHFTQKEFLCDESGKPCVDYIGRFESFETDIQNVCQKLSIDCSNVLHENKSYAEGNYRLHFTDGDRKLVEKYFEWELDYGKYTF